MAHLITLTGAVDGQEMLFNLDTVVSIEKGNNSTIIATRWGSTMVRESLQDPLWKRRRKENERLTLPPKWSKVVLWF